MTDTVQCPCCGTDMHVPKHRAHTPWLPGQLRVAARWLAAGMPYKAVGRAFGSTKGGIREALIRNEAEQAALWGSVDWHAPPSAMSPPEVGRVTMRLIQSSSYNAWGILWRSDNTLDGKVERLIATTAPHGNVLFHTRQEARAHIRQHYGYIAERPDLQSEPHGWRMPVAQKVRVTVEVVR